MALINCSECGISVSSRAATCPNCGCPVDISLEVTCLKRRAKCKRIGTGITVIVFSIIIFFLVEKYFNRPNTDGYYEKTKWGMTIEQVQKTIKGNFTLGEDNLSATEIIDDYDDIKGVDALVLYGFAENSLQKVSVYLTNSGESSYTDLRLIKRYENKFNELYEEDNKDDLGTYWKTNKSRLELIYLSDGLIVITYEDITKEEE